MGWFSLEERRLREILSVEGAEKLEPGYLVVPNDTTRGSKHTLRHGRFPLHIRKYLHAERDQVLSPCLSNKNLYLPESLCI